MPARGALSAPMGNQRSNEGCHSNRWLNPKLPHQLVPCIHSTFGDMQGSQLSVVIYDITNTNQLPRGMS